MLNYDTFIQGLNELEAHYNKSLTQFAIDTWYNYLKSRLSDERYVMAIQECICTREFMPTAEKLADIAGADTSCPGENWLAYKNHTPNYSTPALPSTEINVEKLTPEQRQANIDKIKELIDKKNARRFRKQQSASIPPIDVEVITLTPEQIQQNILEEMRIYLATGNPELIDRVIKRVRKEKGFELVYNHGKVVDVAIAKPKPNLQLVVNASIQKEEEEIEF